MLRIGGQGGRVKGKKPPTAGWRPLDFRTLPCAGITQVRFARVGGLPAALSARRNRAPLRAQISGCVTKSAKANFP